MIVIMNAEIELNIEKVPESPRLQWYSDLEDDIRDKLNAVSCEIVDINFYDETPEEEEIEW